MSATVAVLDYGFGTVRSALRAAEHVGASAILSSDFDTCLNADGLIIPGVGAFAACMAGLDRVRGGTLVDARLVAKRPVLGICVGMQILFEQGIEHGVRTQGLGQWPGTVDHLDAPIVPHMGWNDVVPIDGHPLFDGLEKDAIFYFLHSYYFMCNNAENSIACSDYGILFTSAVNSNNVYGIQFHPEKSHQYGEKLLYNFAKF